MAPQSPEGKFRDQSQPTLDALVKFACAIATDEPGEAHADPRTALAAELTAGRDPLGERYSELISAQRRRSIGAVLTPSRIVGAMIAWAHAEAGRSGTPTRIVDAGAGTGRFALAAAGAFPEAAVIAIENEAPLLTLLRANLRGARLDQRVSVIAADFRSIDLPGTAGPTLFLGNPPYVRHHQIAGEWKRWYVEACARHGAKASQLAGAHLHFFAKIADLGQTGDYGCLITAAEWLDVGYGGALRSMLANRLGGVEIHLLEPTAEAFPGTMTTAAVTCFRIGRRPPALRLRGVSSPAQLDHLAGGRAVEWSALASAPKWSVFVRHAPKPPPGAIELGELCRVHRGQVTGANRIWIAGMHSQGLPSRYLKPTVTRAAELIAAEPSLEANQRLARVIDLPLELDMLPATDRAAIEYFLTWARAEGAADGYIARHRSPWWAVRLAEPAPILCTYMARRTPAFVLNRAGARILNIAHGIYPRETMGGTQLVALAMALRMAVTPGHGRCYAGGLLKFEPRELERVPLPPLDSIAPERDADGNFQHDAAAAAMG